VIQSRVSNDQWVIGNVQGLDHIVGNLVQNAINYCPAGSTITLSSEHLGRSVRLHVKDNGPGIAKQHRARIFERFYRVDSGRSREVGGTGLGLSIVKHWVEALRGTIELTSSVGRGTTFSVTLERTDRPSDDDELAPVSVEVRPQPSL
jgi:two-component system phosphate regulon sensor histidine kinase PhoR